MTTPHNLEKILIEPFNAWATYHCTECNATGPFAVLSAQSCPCTRDSTDGVALAEHIMAMADDAYLIGHPEWIEIVEESRRLLAKAKGIAS